MSESRDPFMREFADYVYDQFEKGGEQGRPVEPTYRRFLTPAECAALNLPYGTEGQTDKDGNLREASAGPRDYIAAQASMRLTCLQMALSVADGAAPPPLAEVIERARAYWRFAQTGEDVGARTIAP